MDHATHNEILVASLTLAMFLGFTTGAIVAYLKRALEGG